MDILKSKKRTLYKAPLFLKYLQDTWYKINCENILYIEASSNGAIFHMDDGSDFCSSEHLAGLQAELPVYFERIHRSFIVNINHISNIDTVHKTIQINERVNLSLGNIYKKNIYWYL